MERFSQVSLQILATIDHRILKKTDRPRKRGKEQREILEGTNQQRARGTTRRIRRSNFYEGDHAKQHSPTPAYMATSSLLGGAVLLRSQGGGDDGHCYFLRPRGQCCRPCNFPFPRVRPACVGVMRSSNFNRRSNSSGGAKCCSLFNLHHPLLDAARSTTIAGFEDKECDENNKKKKRPATAAKQSMDQWVHGSVSEIVKNIGRAPFLVHVYSDEGEDNKNGGQSSSSSSMISTPTSTIRLVIEEASTTGWPYITQRWEDGSSIIPSGVILVQRLHLHDDDDDDVVDGHFGKHRLLVDGSNGHFGDSPTKLWGLLVQTRGLNCAACCVCYVLKTCQVQCGFGFCTHFWLTRMNDDHTS